LCRIEQQRFQSEMDKLQHALEAKEAQMQRVVNGTGQVSALKQHYDRVLMDLAGERDVLQADRTRLLQVSSASACWQLFTDMCFTACAALVSELSKLLPFLVACFQLWIAVDKATHQALLEPCSSCKQPQWYGSSLLTSCCIAAKPNAGGCTSAEAAVVEAEQRPRPQQA